MMRRTLWSTWISGDCLIVYLFTLKPVVDILSQYLKATQSYSDLAQCLTDLCAHKSCNGC
jgi:hypothetical protein